MCSCLSVCVDDRDIRSYVKFVNRIYGGGGDYFRAAVAERQFQVGATDRAFDYARLFCGAVSKIWRGIPCALTRCVKPAPCRADAMPRRWMISTESAGPSRRRTLKAEPIASVGLRLFAGYRTYLPRYARRRGGNGPRRADIVHSPLFQRLPVHRSWLPARVGSPPRYTRGVHRLWHGGRSSHLRGAAGAVEALQAGDAVRQHLSPADSVWRPGALRRLERRLLLAGLDAVVSGGIEGEVAVRACANRWENCAPSPWTRRLPAVGEAGLIVALRHLKDIVSALLH